MNNKKNMMVIGVISIISTLLMTGIPFGVEVLQICNVIVFFAGIVLIIFFGMIRQNDKLLMIISITYAFLLFAITIIIESTSDTYTLLAVGFIPGLLMSIAGLRRTHKGCRSKICYIVNAIALLISVLSVGLIFLNGGIII